MISLRNFMDSDAIEFQQKRNVNMSVNEIKALFAKWKEKEFEGKYFEMFAVIKDNELVGMISLYKHSENVISCGPETFSCYRKQGIAEEAVRLVMDIAKRITYFRTLKSYSVNKLANLAGLSQSYLRDIELGNKNPTVETLSYICDALEISLKDFFNEETQETITDDPLIKKICQLNKKQRNTLAAFLDAMKE